MSNFIKLVDFKALEINTESLRVVDNANGALTDHQVHELRLAVKRLRASWYLFKRWVPPVQYRETRQRLKAIHDSLAVARDERVLASTASKLIGKTKKAKVRTALETLSAEYARRASLRRHEQIPIDLVAEGFRQELNVWRELDLPDAEEAVLDRYARTYRQGRTYGKSALIGADVNDWHEWRRWVKNTYFQLDIIGSVLGKDNLARRSSLDRLGDILGKHNDLDMLHCRLAEADLSARQVTRIDRLIEARKAVFRSRARKLYPRLYGSTPKEFRAAVSKDVGGVVLDNVVMMPRSA